MKVEIKVPPMGESITQAVVGVILKSSGTPVAAEEELLELETDKVNQVLYAPKAGVVAFQVQEGEQVAIGQVIGFVDTDPGAAPAKIEKKTEENHAAEKYRQQAHSIKPAAHQPPQRGQAQPAQQPEGGVQQSIRLGKEEFFEQVRKKNHKQQQATNPTGQQQPQEAKRGGNSKLAAATAPPAERPETRRRMTNIRKVIAERLVHAKNSAAMLTTFNEVDMTAIMALRESYRDAFMKRYGTKLGLMSFFIKAAVHALQRIPDLNCYLDGDQIVHREYYDIGVAVGTDRGLIVPVIRDCDALTFAELEGAMESYAHKAREGTLAIADLQGGGFTITNGGVYGSLLSTPILNPPQCGILGMHKIQKRPVAINDAVVIRPMMYLALSYDHRIVDGKEAVGFLIEIKNVLEEPSRLLLQL